MGPKTPGHDRLVTSIQEILKKAGKKVSRTSIEAELSRIDKDTAFKSRISRRAREVGNDGYIWGSIRKRAVQHFTT